MRPKVIVLSITLLAVMGLFLLICLFGVAYSLKQMDRESAAGGVSGQPAGGEPAGAGTHALPGSAGTPASTGPAGSPDGVPRSAVPAAAGEALPITAGPLHIETDPDGAAVILDGTLCGTAPLELNPAAGLHSLRVEKEGFEPSVCALSRPAQAAPLKITLKPVLYAELTLGSEPTAAEVVIDGEFRGRTPLTVTRIQPGTHELIVKKANYSTHQSVQVFRAGEQKTVNDIRLVNKLLVMLEATLEQEPRSIGNWMELAHYYYIDNDMVRAAAYFTRARELAVQPPPVVPADATEGEKEAVQNEAQWDRSKLMGEIKKHLEMGPTYYGNQLNYEKFRTEYATCSAAFDRWAVGWRDLNWIQNEAFAQSLQGHAARGRDLFLDYVTAVNAKSGVGWAELARAELQLGESAAAELHYANARQFLTAMPAPPEEMKFREIAWLDLGRAWAMAAENLPPAAREKMLVHADESLNALDAYKLASPLTRLEGRVVRAQLFRLRDDNPGRIRYLTEALATSQKDLDALPVASPDRRFLQEEMERLRIQRAWAAVAADDKQLAQDLARALAKSGVAADVAEQANGLLAAMSKNVPAIEPKLNRAQVPVAVPGTLPAPEANGAPAATP